MHRTATAPERRATRSAMHRAKGILRALHEGAPSPAELSDALQQLDALPGDDLRAALASFGPLPSLDDLDEATRRKHGLPLRPLRLCTTSVVKDADLLDLGPVAEEQIRTAGITWDGADLAAEERLDGELEGSFAGTLERRTLASADAPDTPLFDVLLLAEDAGVVFAAGSAKVIALIAYGKVELRDRRTRVAIEEALAESAAPKSVEAKAATAKSVEAKSATPKSAKAKSVKTKPAKAASAKTKSAKAKSAKAKSVKTKPAKAASAKAKSAKAKSAKTMSAKTKTTRGATRR